MHIFIESLKAMAYCEEYSFLSYLMNIYIIILCYIFQSESE